MNNQEASRNRNLSSSFRIIKVLSKTTSKVFGKVKEEDIIIISLPIVNNSGWSGAKQVYADVFINRDGDVNKLGSCSMSGLNSYIGPGSGFFEIEELDNSALADIKLYCKELCLTNDPELCKNCPLNKFNKI